MEKRFIYIFIVVIIASFLIAGFVAIADVGAPSVVFSGDDLSGNGGVDDAYDALIELDIKAPVGNPTIWDLEYSNNGGSSWLPIDAKYQAISNDHRVYYWSTSKIYAPILMFRARNQFAGNQWTDYFTATLYLTHKTSSLGNKYYVESFNDQVYQDGATDIYWNFATGTMELFTDPIGSPNPPYSPAEGWAYSTNIASAGKKIITAIFKAVQVPTDSGIIEYQLSNDGVNWFGSTGINSVISLDDLLVGPVTINFSVIGDELYWRARLETTDKNYTPQVFQLSIQWQENNVPQACFTVSPLASDSPTEIFYFNADCATDLQDSLDNLDFRWDWENDDTWDTGWLTGLAGYNNISHVFNSTSTFEVELEVRDSLGEIDNFVSNINTPGVEEDIFGWLWSSNYGWTSLNCDNTYYGSEIEYCPPNYGWKFSGMNIVGWAWDSNLGWLCIGTTCSPYGNTPLGGAPSVTYAVTGTTTAEVLGWGKYLVFGESGWLRLNWQTDPGGVDCNQESIGGENYCVTLDYRTRSLEGWGWAGGEIGGIGNGPGWVLFSGSINIPWLETKYGSIYSRNNVGSINSTPPADNRYTASYCILSGGDIIKFESELGCEEPDHKDYGFPSSATDEYTLTKLGKFSLPEVLARHSESVKIYSSIDVDASLPNILDGKVYVFQDDGVSDYYIDAPMTFYNANTLDGSGAGTVIIHGNLNITSGANLYYEENPVSHKILNLASVAWIVYGDVNIDPDVSKLVGSFIVLGKGSSCPNIGCGIFKTGDDTGALNQLAVSGLVMARQFNFERLFKTSGEPAEIIFYDGRALINTPPGLENVAGSLPIWREAFSSTQIEN